MTLLAPKSPKSLIPSVLSDFFDNDTFLSPKWLSWMPEDNVPAVNIKETDTEFTVDVAAPGFEKKDFKISIDHDLLSISAAKEQEDKEEKENYRRREFSFQSFSRSFRLPKHVVADNIQAVYDKGMLQLHVPKSEPGPAPAVKEITVA